MDPSDLYGLPLDQFVPERTALAKALRGEGRRDEAARVAKLAKPSVAAWAVNQLVRTQRRAVDALFDAGDGLQQAQADVIAGRGDARALREAAARERAAVGELTEVARGLLTSAGQGMTAATLERVSDTLHAAALEPEARAEVTDGCLVRELRHIGMGGAAAAPAPAARRPAKPERPRRKVDAGQAEAQAETEQAKARAEAERERAQELAEARRAEQEARREAARAEKDLGTAHKRRDKAGDALRAAEEAMAAAQQAMAAAEQAVAEAEERATKARDAHAEAQQALERL